MKKISGKTQLAEFQFPYLRHVLEDVFLLPPKELVDQPMPESIEQLCQQTGFGLDDSIRRLRDLYNLSQHMVLDATSVEEIEIADFEFLWIARDRDPEPRVLEAICKTCKDLTILSEIQNFQEYFNSLMGKYPCNPKAKIGDCGLIILAGSLKLAWSGALYMRQEGFRNTFAMDLD